MAKKLIYDYTIDANANKISVKGNHRIETLLIITDITAGKILYKFANPAFGFVSSTFNSGTGFTDIVLEQDLDAIGVTNSDKLQIFFEDENIFIEPSQSLVDPVHKLRVSNPENLIDTDFEYGLQSTKWETLELVNNIPSIYTSAADTIQNITSVTTTINSNVITVTTEGEHGLVIGTPIDVQGLDSATAEGKYIIKAVPTAQSFTYQCRSSQGSTSTISGIYTTIIPGEFYTSAEIQYDSSSGYVTDQASQSKLTITTLYDHGFSTGTQFYLLNTLGAKSLIVDDPTATADDGLKFSEFGTTADVTLNPLSQNQCIIRRAAGPIVLRFNASDINGSGNLAITGHGLKSNDYVQYNPSGNDVPFGGLTRFQVYIVHWISNNEIQLSTDLASPASNTQPTGSFVTISAGSGTTTYGNHSLHLVYAISRLYISNNYLNHYYPHAYTKGTNGAGSAASGEYSGWQLKQNTNYGRGGTDTMKHMVLLNTGRLTSTKSATFPGHPHRINYVGSYGPTFMLPVNGMLYEYFYWPWLSLTGKGSGTWYLKVDMRDIAYNDWIYNAPTNATFGTQYRFYYSVGRGLMNAINQLTCYQYTTTNFSGGTSQVLMNNYGGRGNDTKYAITGSNYYYESNSTNWNNQKPYQYFRITSSKADTDVDGMPSGENWNLVFYWRTDWNNSYSSWDAGEETTNKWHIYPEAAGRTDGQANQEPGYFNYYNDPVSVGYEKINAYFTHYQGTSSGYLRAYSNSYRDTSPDWYGGASTSDNYDSGLFAIPLYDESDFLNIYWPNHGLANNNEVQIFNLDNQIVLEDATGSAGDRMLLDGTDNTSTNAGDCIDVEEGISTNIRTYGADWFNNHNFSKDQFTANYEQPPSSYHQWGFNNINDVAFQGTPHYKRFRGARLNAGGAGTSSADPLVIDGDSFDHTGAEMRLGSGTNFLKTGVSTHMEYEVPSGSSLYVEVVNSNYIRLKRVIDGDYLRIKTFGKSDTGGAGVYKLIGKKTADTQGSFFIEGHNLSENTALTFDNTGGGSYPTVSSQGVYFDDFNTWASNLMVNTVTNKWDHDGTHSNINIYDQTNSTSGENFHILDGVGDMFASASYQTTARYYTGTANYYGGFARYRQGNSVFNPWLSSLPNARGYGTASNYNEFLGTRVSTTTSQGQSDIATGGTGVTSSNDFQTNFPAKIKYGYNTYQLGTSQRNLWGIFVCQPKDTGQVADGNKYLQFLHRFHFGSGKLYPGLNTSGSPQYQGNEAGGTWDYGMFPAFTGNNLTGWAGSTTSNTKALQSGSIDTVQFVLEPATTNWTTDQPDYLILDSTNGSADAGDNILHEPISLGNWRFASWAHQTFGGTDNTVIQIQIGIDSPTNIGTDGLGTSGLGIQQVQAYRYYSSWRGNLTHLTNSIESYYTLFRGSNYIYMTGLLTHNSGVRVSDFQVKGVIVQVMQDFIDKVGYQAAGFNDTTTYYANVLSDNRFRLKDTSGGSPILTTTSGTGQFTFSTDTQETILGINDGAYSASNIPSEKSLEISVPYQIKERELEFTSAGYDTGSLQFTFNNHGLFDGAPITYDNGGNADATNLTNSTVYYAIVGNQNTFSVKENLNDTDGIAVSNITGTHKWKTSNIAGRGEGAGTVSIDATTRTLIGTNTLFRRYYLPGDTFQVEDATITPSVLKTLTVDSIASDTEMRLTTLPTFTSATAKYFVNTKIYTRPSGSFIHRPFDGGVEIKAGNSPNSIITRQTRKYFRYQSGKGIQCSLAINFNPPVLVRTLQSAGSSTCTVKTQYPHGITQGCSFKIEGATNDTTYNGTFTVASVTDDFTFTYVAGGTPSSVTAEGNIQFHAKSWDGALVRGGMFDYQNGFFYEFDGTHMYCVRRSSTLQISGTATLTNGSGIVTGEETSWNSTLAVGNMIVIRGQSYKIVKITNNSNISIQPAYKGTSSSGVIITKTVDTRVRQDSWNVDPCDGTGRFGFNLDVDKIQMAYFDYSWYGAGKIRFGFKDQNGQVKYVHDFKHNNILTEAYFRSGNLPGRYEIENTSSPTFVPNLFHWGTSIIMDGTFNDDEAYLFTANSNTLSSTNGQSNTATSNAAASIIFTNTYFGYADFYLQIPFPASDASKLQPGTTLYSNLDETGGTSSQNAANLTENNRINTILQAYANGNIIDYTGYSGSTIYAYVYIGFYNVRTFKNGGVPTDPSIGNSSPFSLGADVAGSGGGGTEIDLTLDTPLVSIRLAPAVDSGISGAVGTREIINRMQLKLRQIGIVTTHDTEVSLILNGNLNNTDWEKANQPSLSQYIPHNAGDLISSGSKIYTFRASGGQQIGSTFQSLATDFDISELSNLGNSILGGDRTFPDGPDVITITVKPIDTTNITANGPFAVSGRLSWAESQA